MPPFLIFCSGVTVAADCGTINGSNADFGSFSKTAVKTVNTQFAVATNDPTGYAIYVTGTTLTSGNNTINAMSTKDISRVGQEQFGLNLRQNSSPSSGSEVTGVGTGVPLGDYSDVNNFTYRSGDMIARSPLSTDFNRFTVTYIANIAEDQPPGLYSTTLSYLAVVQF